MNKKIIKGLILIVLAYISSILALSFFVRPEHDSARIEHEAEAGESISIWYWDSSITSIFEDFKKAKGYDNLNLDFTYIPNYEYSSTLSKAIASGNTLPDICVLHGQILSDFISLPIWEAFDKPPYSLEPGDFPRERWPHILNKDNVLTAIPVDVPVSGIAYRSAAMMKAFGFNNPDEVSEYFPDWNTMIDKVYQVKKEQKKDIYLFACLEDPSVILFNQTDKPYMNGPVFTGTAHIKESLDILCRIEALGLADDISSCSPKWYETFSDDKYLFMPWSSWLMQNGSFENNKSNDWKLITPPGGSYGYGASVCVIPSKSEHKDLAYEFIQYWLMSDEGALNQLRASGLILTQMQTSKTISRDFTMTCFGNENIGEIVFDEFIPNAKIYPCEDNTSAIRAAFQDTVTAINHNKGMTSEEAYQYFKKSLSEALPDVIFQE